jgi:hypothetical protein
VSPLLPASRAATTPRTSSPSAQESSTRVTATRGTQASQRESKSVPLEPPKPKAFVIAWRTWASRAMFAT